MHLPIVKYVICKRFLIGVVCNGMCVHIGPQDDMKMLEYKGANLIAIAVSAIKIKKKLFLNYSEYLSDTVVL